MNLPGLDNNSQLSPLLDGEQGQGDQQRAVQGHLVKVVHLFKLFKITWLDYRLSTTKNRGKYNLATK